MNILDYIAIYLGIIAMSCVVLVILLWTMFGHKIDGLDDEVTNELLTDYLKMNRRGKDMATMKDDEE